MTIAEMKEKRNRIVKEATDLVKTEMTAEVRAKIDAIYADADALKGDIERSERAEAMEQELRSSKPLPAASFASDESETRSAEKKAADYKRVFNKYLRGSMDELNGEERGILRQGQTRAQSSASGAAGLYLVQTDLAKEIEVGLKWYGGMRQVASQFSTSGVGNIDWPTLNDTTNPGKRLNATTVPGTADEVDLTFGQVVFGAWTYTTEQITVQNELLQDAAFDIESIIKEAFITRIGRAQNTDFTVGTGSSQPTGIVTATTAGVTAATGGATSVTYNNLVDLIHSVDIAYRPQASFMFHDTTLAALRKLTDAYGRPLLGMGINGGDPDAILGYKYQVNNDMSILTNNAKSILFGKFANYKIRDIANSMNIMKLDQVAAAQNATVFVGFTRADAQLIEPGTKPVKQFVNSAT